MNLKNNPELIPLIEWWEKDGKSTVLCLLVAAVAVAGFYGWKNHRIAKRAAASDVLTTAFTTEELEEAVNKYSGMDAAVALKIRLAKSYFDAENYDLAMATYEELSKAPAAFADIPVVGKAHCLEAKGDFAAALAAFDDFVEKNPTNYLKLTAQLGAVRCLAQQEKKDEALNRVAALKGQYADDEGAKARIEAVEQLVKRFEKKAPAVAEVPAPAEAEKTEAKTEEKPAESK